MDNLLPVLPIALLALACPLVMGGMGVGVWLIARARGEKKAFSMSSMPGLDGDRQPAIEDTELRGKLTRLEREVQTLGAELEATRTELPRHIRR